jgi:hypothetical protein
MNNPLRGTDYACDGTVTRIGGGGGVYVMWDNERLNVYSRTTLELINTKDPLELIDTKDPNILFKHRKIK